MPDNKKTKNISDFELGSFFSRLDTKMDSISAEFRAFIKSVQENHNDHEIRLREVEKNYVKKSDHEDLERKVWRIIIFLASTGAGGTALYQFFGG